MAREIKFRAWEKTHQKMWSHYAHIGGRGRMHVAFEHGDEDFVTMQFTGLKDKNGKEIYEGDIIAGVEGIYRRDARPTAITFEKGVFGFNGTSFSEGESELNWTTEKAEVIGNIYENPDLLKV